MDAKEIAHSIHGSGETWNSDKKKVESIVELEPFTNIRLIKRNCVRLVQEQSGNFNYYFCLLTV